MNCKFCESEFKTKNALLNHELRCKKNKDRKYKNGMTGHFGKTPWNKGQTKENNETIKLAGEKISKAIKGRPAAKISDEGRQRISEFMSLSGGNGGKSKWFEVSGQKVQGTWERDFAIKLNELGYSWKSHPKVFKYEVDGKLKSYTPDFYVQQLDAYIEVKGFWWGNDREKMNLVIEQNKSEKFIILFGNDFKEFIKSGKMPL